MNDWPQMIKELNQAGVSIYKIALMVQRHYRTVQRWAEGAEPKYSEGQRLLEIYRERVPRETTMVKNLTTSIGNS